MASKNGPQPVGEMIDEGHWRKTIWIPEVEPKQRIQVARLERALAIEKRAADDAVSNLPAKDETSLNAPQLEICIEVFKGILLLNQFLSEQVGLALQKARQLTASPIDANDANEQVTGAVEVLLSEKRPELTGLRLADLREQRNLRHFRLTNRLSRTAHYKESSVLLIGVLLFAFMAESMMNGSLLAAVMADGWAGGAMLAGLISMINIGTGILAGLYGWRLIGHVKLPLRILGGVLTLVLHGAALTWNVFIAHFREVAETAASNANFDFDMAALGAATLQHMADNGLAGMGSVQAWALLMLGVLIHFLAAKEGWDDVADRYLDYKKVDRKARHARSAFDEKLAEIRTDARHAVEDLEATIEAEAARAKQNAYAIAGLLDLANQRRQEVKDSEDEWVAGGAQLLKVYRTANTTVRDEHSAPVYFKSFPTAADYRQRNFGAGMERTDEIEQRSRSVAEAIAELERLAREGAMRSEEAQAALAAVRRHSTAEIRRLDKRLEQEDRTVTRLAEKQLQGEIEGLDFTQEAVSNAA